MYQATILLVLMIMMVHLQISLEVYYLMFTIQMAILMQHQLLEKQILQLVNGKLIQIHQLHTAQMDILL